MWDELRVVCPAHVRWRVKVIVVEREGEVYMAQAEAVDLSLVLVRSREEWCSG